MVSVIIVSVYTEELTHSELLSTDTFTASTRQDTDHVKDSRVCSYLEHIGGGAAGVECSPASDGGQGPGIGGGGPGQTDRANLGRGGEVDRDSEAHQGHVIVRGETEMNRLKSSSLSL